MRNEREYSTSDFGIQKEHLENQAVGGRNETALDNTDRKFRSNCRDMIKDSRMLL